MRVFLVVFLVGLGALEYFYRYSENVRSASSNEITAQDKPAGIRQPPSRDYHGH